MKQKQVLVYTSCGNFYYRLQKPVYDLTWSYPVLNDITAQNQKGVYI